MATPKEVGFRFNRGMILLAALIAGILAALCVSSLTSSSEALKLATQSNSTTVQSSAIILAQREVLVYAVRFAEWIDGDITRRDLQISRATLAQRLNVLDMTGESLGHRANPEFLSTLRESDAMVATGGPGFLPSKFQTQFKVNEVQILDGLIAQGHILIDLYTTSIGGQIARYADSQHSSARLNLILLLLWLILSVIFVVWVFIKYRVQFRAQKRAAFESQQSLKEVREELGEAQEAVLELQSLNEAKSDFVATVNHELRTPLTSIIGYIDMLKDFSPTDRNQEFHKYLDVMDRNASVLLELVESILFLSDLDEREVPAETTLIDLVDICEECISTQGLGIGNANLNLSSNYTQGESYSVIGNVSLLRQVFINVLSNAIKFSPGNSKIEVNFSRIKKEGQDEIVRVEVRDSGIGIPPEEIPHLFSRFFRASNASGSNIAGSGVGLAIVKRIVDLHRGSISVQSTLGQGTSMIIDLPYSISPIEALVMGKRQEVLERGINSVAGSHLDELVNTTHDVGGAIGFYTFTHESSELLKFSRWLKANPDADPELVLSKQRKVLDMLNETLEKIKEGDG